MQLSRTEQRELPNVERLHSLHERWMQAVTLLPYSVLCLAPQAEHILTQASEEEERSEAQKGVRITYAAYQRASQGTDKVYAILE